MKRCTVYDFQTVPAICKRRYIDELGLFLCLDMISYYVLIDTRAVAGEKTSVESKCFEITSRDSC